MAWGTSTRKRVAAAAALALLSPLVQGSLGRTTSLDERLLAAHNRERTAAGLQHLAWDPVLAAGAAQWGAELAARGDLEHASDEESLLQGENLWLGTKGAYTPEEMVGAWIDEKRHFRRGRIPDVSATGTFEDVGHYTQLMWHETDRVGCAVVDGEEDEVLVCRYLTAGNVEGEQPF